MPDQTYKKNFKKRLHGTRVPYLQWRFHAIFLLFIILITPYQVQKAPQRRFKALQWCFHAIFFISLIYQVQGALQRRFKALQWCFKWNSSSMHFFFSSLIGHNSILNQASFSLKFNFEIIEFQNRGTDLYSFKTGTYCQIFFKIGVKGQNPRNFRL